MSDDPTDRGEFLARLPTIERGERFQFGCHPGVDCFNECCSDLDCVLSPYDVLRLRDALGISGREFMTRYADIGVAGDSGLPVVMLKMREDERRSCPFVAADGCTVYADRPSPCRTFPLGRGTSVAADGRIEERFALVREDHCHGFAEPGEWTPEEWMSDQELGQYNRMNDAFCAFTESWRATGRVLDRPRFSMVYFGLYHLDEFAERIERKGWLDQLGVDAERRAAILGGGEPQLAFAFEWLGAVLGA
jgi:Fe-S-cluster containining protein